MAASTSSSGEHQLLRDAVRVGLVGQPLPYVIPASLLYLVLPDAPPRERLVGHARAPLSQLVGGDEALAQRRRAHHVLRARLPVVDGLGQGPLDGAEIQRRAPLEQPRPEFLRGLGEPSLCPEQAD